MQYIFILKINKYAKYHKSTFAGLSFIAPIEFANNV